MSRFLFVMPPFAGHVGPAAGVAAELGRRGHEIAWAGTPEVIRPLTGAALIFECAVPPFPERPESIHGFAALKFRWENVLVPLGEAMEPGVRAAVTEFRPDVLVVDQQAVAGALVANRAGLRWATSASTSAELSDPPAGLPKVAEWLRGLMRGLQERFGDPQAGQDPRFSPALVLAFTTEELARTRAAGPVRFVGPSIQDRTSHVDFPWQALDPARRLVLVTLGTAGTGPRFLTECAAALRARSRRLQAVVVDPTGSLPGSGDVIVRRKVPRLALLERASALVCHAGYNTVCESLYHGVPLVVAPIRDDQPTIADQVVRAGAGIRLRFSRSTATQIGAAVDAVLDEPVFREGAEQVRKSFHGAGGAPAAADALEQLAAS
ncbi:MAG TPA: nucleotide disphospho-sugar-binding domain-containing protein [Amycolatopsis sp.]|uniref:glycosyltransferase n=1 Tax=Amycolatopsis sp. TaxID=37632 RepID=UPI002B477514|nr:nucleotide disphospho-sugar-binding domain-containing protein [Amycolatopsis sp.]HKS48332.1 nucleotide disphospho-sugar-binding domain-containing protein [Amycolatopsis sp.]